MTNCTSNAHEAYGMLETFFGQGFFTSQEKLNTSINEFTKIELEFTPSTSIQSRTACIRFYLEGGESVAQDLILLSSAKSVVASSLKKHGVKTFTSLDGKSVHKQINEWFLKMLHECLKDFTLQKAD